MSTEIAERCGPVAKLKIVEEKEVLTKN